MNESLLHLYLNDHLAGSAAAIQLAKKCRKRDAPSALSDALSEVIAQIEEDKQVLERIIASVRGSRSYVRRCAGWLGEWALSVKLATGGTKYRPLNRVEELEVLLLGVHGKLALWQLLERLDDGRMSGTDFARMRQRAAKQLETLDRHRLPAALEAFQRR